MKSITIGTRASKLAMIQTQSVATRLRQQWPDLDIAIEQIHTTGDRVANVPLAQIGGDGVFVIEIERALQERRIDLAVHSLKDLPTLQPDGLRLIIAGPREDVRDVLIANTTLDSAFTCRGIPLRVPSANSLSQLGHPQGDAPTGDVEAGCVEASLRIGTSSLRRTAQLREMYPDAQILPIRGNVDTRLRKLEAGDYDAIVLAAAGLHRMDLHERLAERLTYFPIDMLMPAPGQGALALEIRDESELRNLLATLQDKQVQAATCAERMFMRRLGAGCYLPVAAYGEIADDTLTLRGLVISLDGQRQVRVQQRMRWTSEMGSEYAEQLGISAAEEALAQGADEIIHELESSREREQQHV